MDADSLMDLLAGSLRVVHGAIGFRTADLGEGKGDGVEADANRPDRSPDGQLSQGRMARAERHLP